MKLSLSLKSTNFMWSNKEESNIAIKILEKLNFYSKLKIMSHLKSTNSIAFFDLNPSLF